MRVSLELQPCYGNMTGIGLYTLELARHLRPGDGVSFQGNMFNFRGRHDHSALRNDLPFDLVENHLFPYGIYRRIWDWLPVDYGAFFGEADVTHFFNFIVPPRIRGKVITTVHDMTHIRYPETVARKNITRLQKGLDRSIQRSSLILTPSEFSKREIVELCGVPEKSVEVVYPAAAISGALCDREELFARLGVRPPYLLYVGSIEPRKNLTRLLRAFDRLRRDGGPDCQLVLCGGNGWNNEDFYETLSGLEHRDAVLLTGYLPQAEKNTLYANARAFVFPSIYEGFGVPVLEAMYWKTPVVCSNVASLPEVAGEAACYVDPFSEESIAQGIGRVLADAGYAQALAERGRRQYTRFSWESSARKLERLYRAVGEGRNGAAE